MEEIEDKKREILENEVSVPGKGRFKLKQLKNIPNNNPYWSEFLNYKALKYREIFEVLICVYNQEKANIKSLETE